LFHAQVTGAKRQRDGRSYILMGRVAMADVEEWLIEAKTARQEGRLKDAAQLYERAAGAETHVLRAGHARRHAAEIWIKNGQVSEGRAAIAKVMEVYRAQGVGGLELANALRVQGLAAEVAGEFTEARAAWSEAGQLYEEVGAAEGVAEAKRRVAKMSAA